MMVATIDRLDEELLRDFARHFWLLTHLFFIDLNYGD